MTQERAAKIPVAVCGFGHWGRNYVRNFSEIRESRVEWCCELNPKGLDEVRERYPQVRVTADLNDVLKDPGVKAVIVSTSASTHYDLVKRCLTAGKDVLVEKPLSLDSAEGEELTKLAEKKGLILMVGHTFLFNNAIRKMKELVQAGEIGKIYYLKAVRCHLGLIREDVDVAWDLATHDVSIFNHLLEIEPTQVHAVGSRFLSTDRDDAAFITLRYGKELLGHIHVSWADSNKQRIIEVVGSKGRILFDDLNTQEPLRLFQKGISLDNDTSNFGEFKYQFRDGDIISPRIKMQEPLRLQCEHFIHCVTTRQKPLTDGANGVAVVRVMEKANQALSRSREGRLDQ